MQLINYLLLYLLNWLQSRCDHPDHSVKADILEGQHVPDGVEWCETCGAFRHVVMAFRSDEVKQVGEWRTPRAAWTVEHIKEHESYIAEVARRRKAES